MAAIKIEAPGRSIFAILCRKDRSEVGLDGVRKTRINIKVASPPMAFENLAPETPESEMKRC